MVPHFKPFFAGRRTIIITVDNCAIEIARDTGLPVIRDTEIQEKLNIVINSEWKTEIRLNRLTIEKWYESFTKIAESK